MKQVAKKIMNFNSDIQISIADGRSGIGIKQLKAVTDLSIVYTWSKFLLDFHNFTVIYIRYKMLTKFNTNLVKVGLN